MRGRGVLRARWTRGADDTKWYRRHGYMVHVLHSGRMRYALGFKHFVLQCAHIVRTARCSTHEAAEHNPPN